MATGRQPPKNRTGSHRAVAPSFPVEYHQKIPPACTASKSGVAGLTRALANELASKGVNVNAIAPGYFSTANTAALRADETRNRQILERIPAGRWGGPAELADASVYLASAASDYVNGHILVVDGGWLGR